MVATRMERTWMFSRERGIEERERAREGREKRIA